MATKHPLFSYVQRCLAPGGILIAKFPPEAKDQLTDLCQFCYNLPSGFGVNYL